MPVITSDAGCLERILTELLNNACKYTPPGEKIWVSVGAVAPVDSSLIEMAQTVGDRPIALKPLPYPPEPSTASDSSASSWLAPDPLDPGFVVIRVCNSGVEIPAAELDRIFEKFYRIPSIDRWNQGGTGLGLALVQKMTEHLGGRIQVTSAAHRTCFNIALPITPKPS